MARGFVQGDTERGGFTVTTDGRVSTTLVQRSFPGATISVFNAGTAVLATIFSDQGGTPLANPFVADSDGHWGFWANPGSYDVQFSGSAVGISAPFTRFAFFVPDNAVTAPIPDPGSNGILARTALQVVTPRTITGTANEIIVVNGDGVAGNPTLSLPASLTFTGKTITGGAYLPTTISGGTHTSITSLSIRSSGAAFDTALAVTEVLTANRTLTLTLNDANRTINLAGNLTTAAAFVTAGANSLTLTTTGVTNVTLPTAGTLATLAGTETFTNKTLTSPRIQNFILDTNGNEEIRFTATGSAVNDITVANAATGNPASISASGDDATVQLNLASKSTASVVIQTNATDRLVITNTPEIYAGNGVTNASPAGVVVLATGGNGTNIAGANLDLSGGKGTGNATPGVVAIRYPLIGASGTTLQSLSSTRYPVNVNMLTNTANATAISNTTTETSLFGGMATSAGSTFQIEGGSARVGTIYRFTVSGFFSTTGTPTGRLRLKVGAVTVADSTAFNMPTTVASGSFSLIFDMLIPVIGATGTAAARTMSFVLNPGGPVVTPTFVIDSGFATIDFTANQTMDITFQWGTANASNSIQVFSCCVDRIR